jgi:hypothetical protein
MTQLSKPAASIEPAKKPIFRLRNSSKLEAIHSLTMKIKLEQLLKAKEEKQNEEAMHIEDIQRLVTEEIEMLKVVLYLISRRKQKS